MPRYLRLLLEARRLLYVVLRQGGRRQKDLRYGLTLKMPSMSPGVVWPQVYKVFSGAKPDGGSHKVKIAPRYLEHRRDVDLGASMLLRLREDFDRNNLHMLRKGLATCS